MEMDSKNLSKRDINRIMDSIQDLYFQIDKLSVTSTSLEHPNLRIMLDQIKDRLEDIGFNKALFYKAKENIQMCKII